MKKMNNYINTKEGTYPMNTQYSLLTWFVSLIVLVVVSHLMALDICSWKGEVIGFCKNVVKLQKRNSFKFETTIWNGMEFLII
jgi:hypothetical protein